MSRHITFLTVLTAIVSISPLAFAQSKPAAKPAPSAVAVVEKPEVPPSLIIWQTDYAKALAEAKRTNKPLMIDFSSASCGWCRIKEKQIDADPVIAKYVNQNFIPVKGAKDLASVKTAFKPSGTPHTLLLTHDGEKLLVRIGGYSKPFSFMDNLHDALELEKAYQVSPESVDAYRAANEGDDNSPERIAAAIEQLTALIEANPKFSAAYSSRAWRLLIQGKVQPAIADFTKAKELAPNIPQSSQYLGIALLFNGKYLPAAKEFETARKLTPRGDYLLSLYQSVALARAGKTKEAKALLDSVNSREYDSAYGPMIWAVRAVSQNDTQEFDKAASKVDEYERGVAYWALGNLQATQGDKAGAIASLQKAASAKRPTWYPTMLATQDLKTLGAAPLPAPAPKPAKPTAKPAT